jgi:hypothetical protein
MKVIIITSAKRAKTPVIINLIKRLSNFICMKWVITVLTFILAIRRATKTENGPKCHPVTATEIVVRIRRTIKTIAWEV